MIYFLIGQLDQHFYVLELRLFFYVGRSKRTNPFIIINISSEIDRSIKILYNTAPRIFIKYWKFGGFNDLMIQIVF